MSLFENLYELIKTHPLKEKILITKNYAQGNQWREMISREFGPVPNVKVQTIEEFISYYAKLPLHKEKIKLINSREVYWVIYSLINNLTNKKENHFETNLLSPGFIEAFHRAILDLRHAGLTAEMIQPELFEQMDKGNLIKQLLFGYESYLDSHKLVDFPGVLPYLKKEIKLQVNQKSLIILHEHVFVTHLEQEMLEQITAGKYEVLKGDPPFYNPDSNFPASYTEFFHSTGILSELKEVLRRMASAEVPLDGAEWISSNYEGYASAAHALSKHYDIPFTFSKGLPIQYTIIGKSAYAYLDWLNSNFHIEPMLQAIKNYYIKLSKEESEYFSNGKIVHLLEKLGIGWGQERYTIIERSILKEKKEADKQALAWANNFFQELFKRIPANDGYSPKVVVSALTDFLETFSPPKNEEEAMILKSIQDLGINMGNVEQGLTGLDSSLDFVRGLLEGLRCQVSPVPEPGKVHFSGIDDGGYSGRYHTYIVGMDEINWSVKSRQDSILLDEERIRLSKNLKTSQVSIKEKLQERDSRFGSIRKNCTMSFCSFSPIENEGNYPAYEMLKVYRKKMAENQADMELLLQDLGEPIYFSGGASQVKSSDTEIWLQSLIGETKDVSDGKTMIFAHYNAIANGQSAITSRKGLNVTTFDGFLNHGLTKEDFGSLTFSATQLELFAACSLQFYFKNILGIRPKENKEFDRTRWLQSMDRGKLIHSIFYTYMMDRIHLGKIHDQHDRDLLWKMTKETIEQYREQIPAPSLHVAQKEIAEIYKDIEIFIRQEENRSSIPKYLELQIHPDDGSLEVELSEKLKIPLRGFVDRVDEIEPHVYRIYDYKTGKSKKFEDVKYFAKGTQLQHALYSLAVEQWLRMGDDPDAVVREAVYYFPTEKGLGKEVVRKQDRRDILAQLIESMLDAIRNGVFIPTDDHKNCLYCDYKEVCGDHAKWRKDKLLDDERFQSLIGVKRYD